MTTWNSKFVLLAALAVAGCDEAATDAFFAATKVKPVIQANLVGGEVTLVAPPGFCIDRANLRPQFALLARCDALGADSTQDAPIGVISVSVAPADPATDMPSPDALAETYGLSAPRNASKTGTLTLFRAQGPSPVDGMSDTQWRAVALIGSHMLGLVLYGPDNGRAITDEGAGLLNSLVERTRAQSTDN